MSLFKEPEPKRKNLALLWDENFTEELSDKNKTVVKIYNIEQHKEQVKGLIKQRQNFEVIETTTSVKIKHYTRKRLIEYWYLENTKSTYFLILLNKLKRDIKKRHEFVANAKYSHNINDIKYFAFNANLNDFKHDAGAVYELKNVFEADISHAYYRAAYVLGFIEKETYEEIITKMTKKERLRLLGCIATVKTTEIYKNGVLTDGYSNIKQPDTILYRTAWFKICHYIDTALLNFKSILGDDFLFYWVDGIYFKHDPLINNLKESEFWQQVRDLSTKFDIEFKTIALEKFEILNKHSYVEINCYKPNNPKPKRFFPKREQIREYSIVGLNELNKI